MLKRNILKKLGLLATTCLFGISSASAAVERVTTGSPAEFGNSNGLDVFTNGVDYVRLGGNHNLATLAPLQQNYDIRGINLDGYIATFETFSDTQIGSIVNPGINGGLHLDIKDTEVILTGLSGSGLIAANDYSGLKSVNFNSFSLLTINSPNVNFSNSFKSTGGDNGIISVLSSGVTFSGSFNANAGNRVREIEIYEDLGPIIFAADLNLSEDLIIRQGSSAIFNAGTTVNANQIYLTAGGNDFPIPPEGGMNGDLPPPPDGMGGDLSLPPKVVFEDNTTVNTSIGRSLDGFLGIGHVEFRGGSTINGAIGVGAPVSKVEFTSMNPNHRSSLNNDIYSDQIITKNSTLGIDSEMVNFVGASSFESTILDLGINVAKFSGNSVVFTGDPILNAKFYEETGGHLVADNINIDMSGVNSITINLTDASGNQMLMVENSSFLNQIKITLEHLL